MMMISLSLSRRSFSSVPSSSKPVVIVGGGLAGTTCALALAKQKIPVVLINKRINKLYEVDRGIGLWRDAQVSCCDIFLSMS